MISDSVLSVVHTVLTWINSQISAMWPSGSMDTSSAASAWAWMGSLNAWVPVTDVVVMVGIIGVWVGISMLIKLTLFVLARFDI